jgi:hypothetical protein
LPPGKSSPYPSAARFLEEYTNLEFFNQIDWALYEDSSTWFVPGSQSRTDTPAEAMRMTQPGKTRVPVRGAFGGGGGTVAIASSIM